MLLNCDAGEDSRESLGLSSKEIKPVNPKGNQPWIFIGRTDAEAPILWPPDGKSWLIGKDWGKEEQAVTEDKMIGWHYWLNGYEFEKALGVADGTGSLVCCSPWGCKESNRTEQLNCTELILDVLLLRNNLSISIPQIFWMWTRFTTVVRLNQNIHCGNKFFAYRI